MLNFILQLRPRSLQIAGCDKEEKMCVRQKWMVLCFALLVSAHSSSSLSQNVPKPPGAKAFEKAAEKGIQAVQGAAQKGTEAVQGAAQKGAEAVQGATQKGIEAVQGAAQKGVEAAGQQGGKAIEHAPDISKELLRLGGGQDFIGAGALFPRGNSLPSCNVQLPAIPKAEDIAKFVKIPAEDIANKVIELQAAPFKALGKTVIDGVIDEWKRERDEFKKDFLKKYGKALFLFFLLVVLVTSMFFGIPMRALLLRVPVRKRD
jgi:hypothetical protein